MKWMQVLLNAQAHLQSTHEKNPSASRKPGYINRITQMLKVRDTLNQSDKIDSNIYGTTTHDSKQPLNTPTLKLRKLRDT